MAKRKLTPSEQLVGRHRPAEPPHRDRILARFIGPDGAVKRSTSPESWENAAFRKLRQQGMVKLFMRVGFAGARMGVHDGVWEITERGEPEARAARARVDVIEAARRAWTQDFQAAWKARKAERAQDKPAPGPAAREDGEDLDGPG